jgi:HD-GYP domain-containing protein (c-di-GMP phosphodiesterase class II)
VLNPGPIQTPAEFRLADLMAALSLVTDLGMGHPPEEALRVCVFGTTLARRMGLAEPDVADVYYTTLLAHLGCTAAAHEAAVYFGGDDIAFRNATESVDFARPAEALKFSLFQVARTARPSKRARAIATALTRGNRIGEGLTQATCEVGASMAGRLGLGTAVQDGVYQFFERWDGKGAPRHLAKDTIAATARFAQIAVQVLLFARLGGPQGALEVVRRRSGTALDPGIAEAVLRHGPSMLQELSSRDAWEACLEVEPEPRRGIGNSQIDDVARVFADMVDLKTPFLHGHSSGVAALAEAAAQVLGFDEAAVATTRRAALLHDLGRVGVPTGIWEKRGPLSAGEWEQVRLHAYHSERILSRSAALASLAAVAGMHHERLDGSGYHRGISAASLPAPARVLAAADAYHAMTEERPHRPAMTRSDAARTVQAEAAAGKLDRKAAAAVLEAAGHLPGRTRPAWPAGLTDREVEVFRLVARGRSNKEIAHRLVISNHTVHHHVLHIYNKIGVSTRAGAALFAMQHGLLEAGPEGAE